MNYLIQKHNRAINALMVHVKPLIVNSILVVHTRVFHTINTSTIL